MSVFHSSLVFFFHSVTPMHSTRCRVSQRSVHTSLLLCHHNGTLFCILLISHTITYTNTLTKLLNPSVIRPYVSFWHWHHNDTLVCIPSFAYIFTQCSQLTHRGVKSINHLAIHLLLTLALKMAHLPALYSLLTFLLSPSNAPIWAHVSF